MNTIAILCAARKSIYKSMPDLDVYDIDRDARTFSGGMPIVAHPPCRAWSNNMRHQAKPLPGEKELGVWCCDQLRECGGILEQPSRSHLFRAAALPHPGEGTEDLFAIEVWQSWWGFPTQKATWLCFAGIDRELIQCPLTLRNRGQESRIFNGLKGGADHAARAATTPEFADWLVALARSCKVAV